MSGDTQASAGRNSFQLEQGAAYAEKECGTQGAGRPVARPQVRRRVFRSKSTYLPSTLPIPWLILLLLELFHTSKKSYLFSYLQSSDDDDRVRPIDDDGRFDFDPQDLDPSSTADRGRGEDGTGGFGREEDEDRDRVRRREFAY